MMRLEPKWRPMDYNRQDRKLRIVVSTITHFVSWAVLSFSSNTGKHTHTHTHIYIYIYMLLFNKFMKYQ